MAERNTKVTLSAQVQGYVDAMGKAADKTREVGSEAEKLAQKREAFNTLGKSMLGMGAALTAITVLSIKAAMGWESAWAGVTKTVDGTPEQLQEVEDGLRGLTAVMPAAHAEIAGVAEAAGQLGIKTDSVVAFTKTMIDLGETTNLSANDAATSLARFTNIMGTSQDKVSNLGSALVDLGNNYATTEREIMEMAMRLSGAGKQIGMSEGEVLGLSAALSSVGIEAEAGGSAMSKVMIDIASSVDKGGDRLQQFAAISGVSANEFAQKWQTKPGEALALFVKGLANAESQGTSTLSMLESLGISEVRMRDALLRSASASDQFSAAMETGNVAFEENIALQSEAAKRYATTESKIAMAGNAIRDAAIDFGDVFLPAVGAASDAVAEFAGFMGGLPEPVQGILGVLTGAVGLIALVGGTALLMIPKIANFKYAMDELGLSMKKFTLGGGGAMLALTALVTVVGAVASAHAEAQQRAESYAETLAEGTLEITKATRELTKANLAADKSLLWLNFGSAYDNAEKLGISLDLVTDAANGNVDSMGELDAILKVATGGGEEAQAMADRLGISMLDLSQSAGTLEESVRGESGSLEEARKLMEQKNKVTEKGVEVTKTAAAAYIEAADGASQLTSDVKGLLDMINEANGVGQDAVSQNIKYQDSLAGVDEYIQLARKGTEGYALTLDQSKQAGRDNMGMLNDLAKDYQSAADAQLALDGNTENYVANLSRGRDEVLQRARDLGATDEQIKMLSEHIVAMPKEEVVRILAETQAADDAINGFMRRWDGKRIKLGVDMYGGTTYQAPGGPVKFNAIGNMYDYQAFSSGGFASGIYAGRAGGIHKFAEPETRWETYISGKPDQRERNIGIWQETGRRLGVGQQVAASPGQGVGFQPGDHLTIVVEGKPLTAVVESVLGGATSPGAVTSQFAR